MLFRFGSIACMAVSVALLASPFVGFSIPSIGIEIHFELTPFLLGISQWVHKSMGQQENRPVG